MIGSTIIKINNLEISKETIEKAVEELSQNEIMLELDNFGYSAFIKMYSTNEQFYKKYWIELKELVDEKTKVNYELWSNK